MSAGKSHIDRLAGDTWSKTASENKDDASFFFFFFFFLLYWRHFNISTVSWPVAESYTTHTCPLQLKCNTEFRRLYPWYVFLSREPQRSRLQIVPTTSFLYTRPQFSIPTFLQCPSSLPIRLSFSSKTTFKSPRNCIAMWHWPGFRERSVVMRPKERRGSHSHMAVVETWGYSGHTSRNNPETSFQWPKDAFSA